MDERASGILLVEDDENLLRLNARILRRHGYAVHAAVTIEKALELSEITPFDLAVLDVMLPDGDGFELCEKLRQRSDLPVIFLTGKTALEDKVAGLHHGGDYYLTKPYELEELLAVVESLLRRVKINRVKVAEASVITKGSLTLNLAEHKAYVNGRDAGLTARELAILLALVQSEGSQLPYETIYRKGWGADMKGSSGAVRQQISRLKKKLDEENADDFAILNELGKGYLFMYMG